MQHKLTYKDYNEALKQDKLMALRCQNCGTITVPPRLSCRKCGSFDMNVIDIKGNGTIQTFTIINVAPEGKEVQCPYVIVMVALNEGPWLMGNLSGVKHEDITMDIIGKPVVMGKCDTYSDKYSDGEMACPVFIMA